MKYRYLQGKSMYDMRVMEKDVPEPRGNDVLVRVIACGVCGTDVHILSKLADYSPLGHEISAEVVSVGPAVTAVAPGELVVVEDCTLCGVCAQCKSGRSRFCRNMYTLGDQSGMGEYLLVRENMLHRHDISDPVHAALVEPLAVSLSTCAAAKIPPGGNVAVFGLGVLGLMCARVAKYSGAGKVVCVGSREGSERNAVRARTARAMGADAVFYSAIDDYEKELRAFMHDSVDAVIVTSPPKSLPKALKAASYGAPVVTIGLDLGEEAAVPIDIDRLTFNKNPIIPVFAEPAASFPLSIRLIQEGVIDPSKLITHRFTLDDPGELKDIYLSDRPVIKAVMVTRVIPARA